MNDEFNSSEMGSDQGVNEGGRVVTPRTSSREKTSWRRAAEAERERLRSELGDLEQIATELGLSGRKLCQLLLVDPSAWSRWRDQPQQIPPSIYRALQWHKALIDKNPDWHPRKHYQFGVPGLEAKAEALELKSRVDQLSAERVMLLEEIESTKQELLERVQKNSKIQSESMQIHLFWKLLLLLNSLAILFMALFGR